MLGLISLEFINKCVASQGKYRSFILKQKEERIFRVVLVCYLSVIVKSLNKVIWSELIECVIDVTVNFFRIKEKVCGNRGKNMNFSLEQKYRKNI